MEVPFSQDGGAGEAAWLSYKHGVLNPMSRVGRTLNTIKDDLWGLTVHGEFRYTMSEGLEVVVRRVTIPVPDTHPIPNESS